MNNLGANGQYSTGGNWVPYLNNSSQNQLIIPQESSLGGTGCEQFGQLLIHCFGNDFPTIFSKLPIDSCLKHWPEPVFLTKEQLKNMELPLKVVQTLNKKIGGKGKIVIGGSRFHDKLHESGYFRKAFSKIGIDSDSLFPKKANISSEEKLRICLLLPPEHKQDLADLKDSLKSGTLEEMTEGEIHAFTHEDQGVQSCVFDTMIPCEELFPCTICCDVTSTDGESLPLEFYGDEWKSILEEFVNEKELSFTLFDLVAKDLKGESTFMKRFEYQMVEKFRKDNIVPQIAISIQTYLWDNELWSLKNAVAFTYRITAILNLSDSEAAKLWSDILAEFPVREEKSVAAEIATLMENPKVSFGVISGLVELCCLLRLQENLEAVKCVETYDSSDYPTKMYRAEFPCGTSLVFPSNSITAIDRLTAAGDWTSEDLLPLYSLLLPSVEHLSKVKKCPFDITPLTANNHLLLNHLGLYLHAITNNKRESGTILASLPTSLSLDVSDSARLCFWNTVRNGILGKLNPFSEDKTPNEFSYPPLLDFLRRIKSLEGCRALKKTYLSYIRENPPKSAYLSKLGAEIFKRLDVMEGTDFLAYLSDKEILSNNDCLKKLMEITDDLKNTTIRPANWNTIIRLGKVATRSLNKDLKFKRKKHLTEALEWVMSQLISIHHPLIAYRISEVYPSADAHKLFYPALKDMLNWENRSEAVSVIEKLCESRFLSLEDTLHELIQANRYDESFARLFHVLVKNGVKLIPVQKQTLIDAAEQRLNGFETDVALNLDQIKKDDASQQEVSTEIPRSQGEILIDAFRSLPKDAVAVLEFTKQFCELNSEKLLKGIKEQLPGIIARREVYAHLKTLPLEECAQTFQLLESNQLITELKNSTELGKLFLHLSLSYFKSGDSINGIKWAERMKSYQFDENYTECVSRCMECTDHPISLSLILKVDQNVRRSEVFRNQMSSYLNGYFKNAKLRDKEDFSQAVQILSDFPIIDVELWDALLRNASKERKKSQVVRSKILNRTRTALLNNIKRLFTHCKLSLSTSIRMFLNCQVAISLFSEKERGELRELHFKSLLEDKVHFISSIKTIRGELSRLNSENNTAEIKPLFNLIFNEVVAHPEISTSLSLFNLLVKTTIIAIQAECFSRGEITAFITKMLKSFPEDDHNAYENYIDSFSSIVTAAARTKTPSVHANFLLTLVLFCQGQIHPVALNHNEYGRMMYAFSKLTITLESTMAIDRFCQILTRNTSKISGYYLLVSIDQMITHVSNQPISEENYDIFSSLVYEVVFYWKNNTGSNATPLNLELCRKIAKGVTKPCGEIIESEDIEMQDLVDDHIMLAWKMLKYALHFKVYTKSNVKLVQIYKNFSLAANVIPLKDSSDPTNEVRNRLDQLGDLDNSYASADDSY